MTNVDEKVKLGTLEVAMCLFEWLRYATFKSFSELQNG